MSGTKSMYLNNRNNTLTTERCKRKIRGKTCEYRLNCSLIKIVLINNYSIKKKFAFNSILISLFQGPT